MARKTTALVPQEVAVGEFDEHDATQTAMRVLQSENARLAEQVSQLHLMLTSIHRDAIEDRRSTRSVMLDFEKSHLESIKLREDLLDRKQERKIKYEREREQDRLKQGAFALLRQHAPELIEAFKSRGKNAIVTKRASEAEPASEVDTLRELVSAMTREERAAMLAMLLDGIEEKGEKEEPNAENH